MRFLTLILSGALALGAGVTRAETVYLPMAKQQRVSMVQAAIIYQLTRYIEWTKGKGETLTLCIRDDADLEREMRHVLERKTGGAKRITLSDSNDACDLLYLPRRDVNYSVRVIAPYQDRQVLLVSDAPDFIDRGGMVALVDRDGRISIDLNMHMLQTARFTVNPSLIDIATRVIK